MLEHPAPDLHVRPMRPLLCRHEQPLTVLCSPRCFTLAAFMRMPYRHCSLVLSGTDAAGAVANAVEGHILICRQHGMLQACPS